MIHWNVNIRPVTDWCAHVAIFFNNGQQVGSKSLKFTEPYFEFAGGIYNFLPQFSSYHKVTKIIKSVKYYLYQVGNPMPLVISTPVIPVINAQTYSVILKSDLVKKLNPGSANLWDLIGGWKGLIIGLIIIGVIVYFMNGGSLVHATTAVKK